MKEIKRYLDSRIGQYSFFFEDLDGGYVYGWNENVKMTAAGCMKLPIAMALFKEVEYKKVNLDDRVKISVDDKVFGTGIIHEFGEREYSVRELVIAMLIQSDNTAANKIIDILGIDRINEIIRELGLTNTELNRKTMDERNAKNVVENLTTSLDLCKCWKHLYKKTFLNNEHSEKLIEILRRQQLKSKMSFYIPENFKQAISSKSGDLEGVENDTSLIQIPKGNFAFTIMSKSVPNNVYGNVTLSKCGKMMWDIIHTSWN